MKNAITSLADKITKIRSDKIDKPPVTALSKDLSRLARNFSPKMSDNPKLSKKLSKQEGFHSIDIGNVTFQFFPPKAAPFGHIDIDINQERVGTFYAKPENYLAMRFEKKGEREAIAQACQTALSRA